MKLSCKEFVCCLRTWVKIDCIDLDLGFFKLEFLNGHLLFILTLFTVFFLYILNVCVLYDFVRKLKEREICVFFCENSSNKIYDDNERCVTCK